MLTELTAVLTADLPSQDEAKLAVHLYLHCYIRSILDSSTPEEPAADLTPALAAANRGRALWIEGWRVAQMLDDGRIVASRNGFDRTFLPGEYIAYRGIGTGLKEGCAITVYVAPGSAEIQDSFYYAFGETVADSESQTVLRFYWNIQPAGAYRLMEALTREFNRYQVPFRFKIINNASHFPRREAAVLYIGRRYYPIAALLVESIHTEVLPWLNDSTPLFTRPLARGLAFAEDPGDSFGRHRCAILAAALFATRGNPVDGRFSELRRGFDRQGLSFETPWLNASSSGVYEYPFPTA
jgi:hypothetical protein